MSVRIKPVKLYIRFWEYNNGVGGFSDWCIILVHCNFAKKQDEELHEFVRFFKEYVPRYRYKYIGIKDNPQFNQTLNTESIQNKGKSNSFLIETM